MQKVTEEWKQSVLREVRILLPSSLHHFSHTWLITAWSGRTWRILGYGKGDVG